MASSTNMDLEPIDVEMFNNAAKLPLDEFEAWPKDTSNVGPEKSKHFKTLNEYSIDAIYGRRLRSAASYNDTEKLPLLLCKIKVSPDSADEHGRTALHIAASRGYYRFVTRLLAHGANPNVEDDLGNTPLHLAVYSGSVDTIYRLMAAGCNIRKTSKLDSPLELAECKLKILQRQPKCEDMAKVQVENIIILLRHGLKLQSRNLGINERTLELDMSNLSLDMS